METIKNNNELLIEEIEETEETDNIITEQNSKLLSAEERRKFLKGKLKQRISGKKTNRLNRKNDEKLNGPMNKISELLQNKGINSPDQIDHKLLESVMNVLGKQDLEQLIDKLRDNPVFKEVTNKLQEKYTDE
jgi:hypothetical protein